MVERRTEREGVQATFLMGDMREIPFESHFDAIVNLGTSFGFFDSEGEDLRVIKGSDQSSDRSVGRWASGKMVTLVEGVYAGRAGRDIDTSGHGIVVCLWGLGSKSI